MRPLENILVLDFSTLLPGPLASLILAEAGARVIKVERPTGGDEMRSYAARIGEHSINFAMLNGGKESLAIDLKAPDAVARLTPLLQKADIVLEQFRPGVMERLGLGYEALKKIKPDLIYCAITGWGQDGPKAQIAAHDLNYMAEAGVLGLSAGSDGAPVLPPVLAADIAGGAYPAVMNILLALRRRDQTGEGAFLDISMGENLFAFVYWGLGNGFGAGRWPEGGKELVTGGSPRYQIYRTADGRYLAAAPLEEKFWANFCTLIGLPEALRAPSAPPQEVIAAVAQLIGGKSAAAWQAIFAGHDVCCSIVATLQEAVADPHFAARGIFARLIATDGQILPALPVPVAEAFRGAGAIAPPRLGADTDQLLK